MTTRVRGTLAWQSAVCVDCQGDNKQWGRATLLSTLLQACQSFLIRGTAKVARLRSVAYFSALTESGNGLNLFLCERLSDFN